MKKAIIILILGILSFSMNAQTTEQQQFRKENLEKRIEFLESRNPNGLGIRDTKLENKYKINSKKIEIDQKIKASGREDELRNLQQNRSNNLSERSDAQKKRNPNGYGNKNARLNRKIRVNDRRLEY
ncbi:hypothetical protein [Aquimarina sp. 2201CG5-10]|uniref:hypothetical protein n=1 Tax=Aquimarina callyspongiae TaxID=3098150 RepID=UPI002AB556F9|nr:hypothetical protein [Aquimarina sp. 2201CG5-10]MDY8134316.1 hypothetical protein [Aquimarina sp. 2201CG5-10]